MADAITGCSLGATDLDAQLARFRELGRGAASVDRDARSVVARFRADPPAALLEQTLTAERACCPFLLIDYDADDRRLAISVDPSADQSALDAIALALATDR